MGNIIYGSFHHFNLDSFNLKFPIPIYFIKTHETVQTVEPSKEIPLLVTLHSGLSIDRVHALVGHVLAERSAHSIHLFAVN